jgi:hypothetical protein
MPVYPGALRIADKPSITSSALPTLVLDLGVKIQKIKREQEISLLSQSQLVFGGVSSH